MTDLLDARCTCAGVWPWLISQSGIAYDQFDPGDHRLWRKLSVDDIPESDLVCCAMRPEQALPASPQLSPMRRVGSAPLVRRRLAAAVWTACIVLAVWGGYSWITRDRSPSCSWPLRVRGTATAEQAGLVRCYLMALATRNAAEMGAVAQNIPPAHITSGMFRYSADAQSGVASVNFEPNPVDSTFVIVTIRFADGVTDDTGMLNMIAMGGPSTWRMAIGS